MRCVIFDLDGTLVDTSADLIAAANRCFTGSGHAAPLDPTTRADMVTAFQGGRAMLRAGAERLGLDADAMAEAHYHELLDHYGAAVAVHSRPYPGAIEAVRVLRGQGVAVGICTNKPEGLARQLLTDLEILDLFDSLVGADTLPVRKPDPAPLRAAIEGCGGDPARSILIGDTVTDRDTARAFGCAVVLVSFGPLGAAVRDLDPDEILSDYNELPAVAARLIP